MNNLISIVVPAYNVAAFIEDCLKSVQNQTYIHWEAIVVDDGSQDKTVAIIEKFVQADQRFRLIRQANGGVSQARNTGMSAATGKFLTFLDGDDMWQPDFLRELLAAIQTEDHDMAYCGYTHLYTTGLKRKFSYPYASGHILGDVLQGKTQIHIGAMLVKKELLDQMALHFTEGCLVGQDQEFIWKLVSRVRVQSVSKELMLYRIRGGSAITANWRWQKHIHAFYGFERAAGYILSHPSPFYDPDYLAGLLQERIAYKLFKLIWRMLKNGYCAEVRQLINDERYTAWLRHLNVGGLKAADKLKYYLLASQHRLGWRFAKLL